jgi:ATP-dependent DNA helicase RecQ
MTAQELLKKHFGFNDFRGRQREAIETLLKGENAFVIWPTGAGKSMVYQLSSLLLPDLTLVVSPLIALMQDQVDQARQMGLPFTFINSSLSREDREKRLSELKAGQYKAVYVTPERFRQPSFWDALSSRKVSLLAVDEAHCISQWGNDFRPEYSRIGDIRKRLGNPTTVALTATATEQVQQDILKSLGMPNAKVFWDGVERPNLFLSVHELGDDDQKVEWLTKYLKESQGPKLVYFSLIKRLHETLERVQSKGIQAGYYHGELGDRDRKKIQRQFLNGGVDLLFATPSFGLGVDKKDVRYLIHYEVPGSIESYFQEVGRAGRDGAESFCHLLYQSEDLETQMRFIEWAVPDPAFVKAVYQLLVNWKTRLPSIHIDDLRAQLSFKNKSDYRLETALALLDRWEVIEWPKRDVRQIQILSEPTEEWLKSDLWQARKKSLQMKLLQLVQYAQSEDCRKVQIYKYFGWHNEERCHFCDNCKILDGAQ